MNIFNRLLISVFLLLGTISFCPATGTGGNIITDDKTNPSMVNTLDATDIVDLSAHITNTTAVINNFIIKSLPNASLGILYMADGTKVYLCQHLTQVEADGLKFDPVESCTADTAEFTYVGVSDEGVEGSFATFKIPLTVDAGCSVKVTSDDKNNPEMLNTLGATNILDLSGKDENGYAIEQFIITSLPSANQGILYMADGTTAVYATQAITFDEASGLKFDPNRNFVGEATFSYVSLNNSGVRGNLATVTIPLIAPVGGDLPKADDLINPDILNTLGAVNIIDLSGKDENGKAVNQFIITSLPNVNEGVLYMADGTTAVNMNQTLTLDEARGLKFDPNSNFVGEAIFTYVSLNNSGVKINETGVIIPIVASVGGNLPTSDDKNNPKMLNNLGAVNILDLSGKDENGDPIEQFIITSLPSANQGILYMADGTTAVHLNQAITFDEATGLKFDPNSNFVGDVTFTYVSLNNSGVRGNEATVTIPLVAPVVGNVPTADNKKNPQMSNRLGAVNILDLSGKDENGDAVNQFIITSLPSANQGVLYMADGTTPVQLNQTLTLVEANGLKFNPDAGFVGDVTFTYVALDDNGIKSANATVTIPLINSAGGNAPTADDKLNPKMLNILSAVNILDLSGKDENGDAVDKFIITSLPSANQGVLYMIDGTTPVRLNQTLTLTEANGLKFDPNIDFVGDVKFTYMAVDSNGIKSSNATVTIPVEASHTTDVVSHNDIGIANGNADPIVIDVLGNDSGTLAGATVRLVNSDGTFTDEIIVDGEGTWSINDNNMIVFTPNSAFVGTPSPVEYVVRDVNAGVSNTSTLTIKGQCVCKPYTENIPVFSTLGLFLMIFLTMLIGVHLVQKESIEF